jgi:hypothetical protein
MFSDANYMKISLFNIYLRHFRCGLSHEIGEPTLYGACRQGIDLWLIGTDLDEAIFVYLSYFSGQERLSETTKEPIIWTMSLPTCDLRSCFPNESLSVTVHATAYGYLFLVLNGSLSELSVRSDRNITTSHSYWHHVISGLRYLWSQ